jgi:5-methyltetrahydropteroyltriglutamate--homocysteine methyltransferase
LSADELSVIEDAEIKKVIAKQEAIGLRSVTDGEFEEVQWAKLHVVAELADDVWGR